MEQKLDFSIWLKKGTMQKANTGTTAARTRAVLTEQGWGLPSHSQASCPRVAAWGRSHSAPQCHPEGKMHKGMDAANVHPGYAGWAAGMAWGNALKVGCFQTRFFLFHKKKKRQKKCLVNRQGSTNWASNKEKKSTKQATATRFTLRTFVIEEGTEMKPNLSKKQVI